MKLNTLLSLSYALLICGTSSTTFAQNRNLDDILADSSDLLKAGKPELALALLDGEKDKFSEDPEFLNNLAIAYVGNNEPEIALTILRDIIDTDPMLSIVVHNLLEMELGAAGAKPDQLNPILFMQSVNSYEKAEIADKNDESQNGAKSKDQISVTADNAENGIVIEREKALLNNALFSVLQTWAAAWSDKDFERYILHYAYSFSPNNGVTRSEWLEQRHTRLEKPGNISVTISNLSFMGDNASPRVEFDQTYKSQSYSDRTRKEVSFSEENGRWKINSERTIKTY